MKSYQFCTIFYLFLVIWTVNSSGSELSKEKLRVKAIDTHNSLRALHGSQSLTWDPELENSAQAAADKILKTRRLATSGFYDVGENVAGYKPPRKGDDDTNSGESKSTSKLEPELKDEEIAFNAIMDWYSEVDKFDWENPNSNQMSGVTHFSQIVWNDTQAFGMVVVTESPPGNISTSECARVIVAHYKPVGNVPGEYDANVFPVVPDSEENSANLKKKLDRSGEKLNQETHAFEKELK